jgi:prephenate dehydrogenase
MTITVVGTGLIGGSMALDLKARGFADHIIGVDRDAKCAKQALSLGIVDETRGLREAIPASDLVILAIPVDAIAELLPTVLDSVGKRTVVTDVGSTKRVICEAVRNHPGRKHFVASHPIAGTENSGPSAALENLFDNRPVILCDIEKSDAGAIQMVKEIYAVLNMRVVVMASDVHDRHMAYVSHISHVVSFALATTVLEIEKSEAMIFDLASSGLDSTVRLAKSSPDMWTPIFEQNSAFISEALGEYMRHLARIKAAIDQKKPTEVQHFMTQANEIRRVLDHMTERREQWKQV